jgi:hypothetical protein
MTPTIKLQRRIDESLAIIESLARCSSRPLVAFSGGKDAICVAGLFRDLGVRVDGICEVSWYYKRQVDDIQRSVVPALAPFSCAYVDSLPVEWLRAHPEVIFSDDSKVRAWSFAQRHQRSVRKHAEQFGYDATVFGRRTQENTIPSAVYQRKGETLWQCHPIKSWRTEEVWEYIRARDLPVPWVYLTDHAKRGDGGNSPFYTMRASAAGGMSEAWKIAESLDARYRPGFFTS